MSQVGTAGQASQLATLDAAAVTAEATEAAALETYEAAKVAANQARLDASNYRAFYFGNKPYPGLLDGNVGVT